MYKIDKLDRKILYELDLNARQPFSQLAKKVRSSKQVVAYRVNRMVERGIITGFFTAIDQSKLGYFSFRVYIKLRNISPEKHQEMVEYLNQDKDIWWFLTVEETWDIDFVILVREVFDYYKIWERFLARFKQYVHKYETVVYSHIQGFPKSYLIGKKNTQQGFLISFDRQFEKIDKLDVDILKALSENARMELVELAQKTRAAVKTVMQRVRSLERRKIIAGYRALINGGSIGYRHYKIVSYLLDTKRIPAMQAWAFEHPNIPYLNKTIGGGDFEIEVTVQTHEEFIRILDEFKALFHQSIDHYYYFWVVNEYKMVYYPTQ
ncbi:MAG: winged helix-turn-helix transcriptional regulator [Nanoarchaeota archaeon]|nr:winged helix-turn-helix transcriptional regulator [Nanoarchaeota archaeon]